MLPAISATKFDRKSDNMLIGCAVSEAKSQYVETTRVKPAPGLAVTYPLISMVPCTSTRSDNSITTSSGEIEPKHHPFSLE